MEAQLKWINILIHYNAHNVEHTLYQQLKFQEQEIIIIFSIIYIVVEYLNENPYRFDEEKIKLYSTEEELKGIVKNFNSYSFVNKEIFMEILSNLPEEDISKIKELIGSDIDLDKAYIYNNTLYFHKQDIL